MLNEWQMNKKANQENTKESPGPNLIFPNKLAGFQHTAALENLLKDRLRNLERNIPHISAFQKQKRKSNIWDKEYKVTHDPNCKLHMTKKYLRPQKLQKGTITNLPRSTMSALKFSVG